MQSVHKPASKGRLKEPPNNTGMVGLIQRLWCFSPAIADTPEYTSNLADSSSCLDQCSRLLDLPPGILNHVCTYLNRPARGALRLTCKNLYHYVNKEGIQQLTASAGSAQLWERSTSAAPMPTTRQFRSLLTLLPRLTSLTTLDLTLGRTFPSRIAPPLTQLRSAAPRLAHLRLTVLCIRLSPDLLALALTFKHLQTLDLQALGWYEGYTTGMYPSPSPWSLAQPPTFPRTLHHLRLSAVNPFSDTAGCFITDADLACFNTALNLLSLHLSGVLASAAPAAGITTTADVSSLQLLNHAPALRALTIHAVALPPVPENVPQRKLVLTAQPCPVRFTSWGDVTANATTTTAASTTLAVTPGTNTTTTTGSSSSSTPQSTTTTPSTTMSTTTSTRSGSGPQTASARGQCMSAAAPHLVPADLDHVKVTTAGLQLQWMLKDCRAVTSRPGVGPCGLLNGLMSLQLTLTGPLEAGDLEAIGELPSLRRLCVNQTLGQAQLAGLARGTLDRITWLRLRANLATGELAQLIKSSVLSPSCHLALGGVIGLSWRANTHGLEQDAVALAGHQGGYSSELMLNDDFTSISGTCVQHTFRGLKLNLDALSYNRDMLGDSLAPLLPSLEGLVLYTTDNPAHLGRVLTAHWLRYTAPRLRLLGAWQTSDLGEQLGRALLRATHKHLLPFATRSSFAFQGSSSAASSMGFGRRPSSVESADGHGSVDDTTASAPRTPAYGSQQSWSAVRQGRASASLGCTPLKHLVLVGTDPVTSIMTKGGPAMCLQEVIALVGSGFKLQLIMTPTQVETQLGQIAALHRLRTALKDLDMESDCIDLHVGTIG